MKITENNGMILDEVYNKELDFSYDQNFKL